MDFTIPNIERDEGGCTGLSQSERRSAIIAVLCQRRFESLTNLASEFDVTTRTIKRDVLDLSRTYPITTIRGHNGGIKMEAWFNPDRKVLSNQQENLLIRLKESLSGEDLIIMNTILVQFGTPRVR